MRYEMVTLTIGHNVNGTPTHTTEAVCEAVSAFLGVEAYTAIPCYGMWRGEAEASTRVEIVAEPERARLVLDNVKYLAHALEQCEIMTAHNGKFAFVGAATPEIARRSA